MMCKKSEMNIKSMIRKMSPVIDAALVPFIYPAAILFKGIRSFGVHQLPWCKRALLSVGVFPVRNSFWNEQYLLEAFLTHNDHWEILAALNYLQHTHRDQLQVVVPLMSSRDMPGSLYMQKSSITGCGSGHG